MKNLPAVLALLLLLLSSSPAKAGEFTFQFGFFPNAKANPEDPWEMQLFIQFETQGWGDRLKDLKEKDVLIVVRTKEKKVLYKENLKVTASDPRAVITWQNRESVSAVVEDPQGKVHLERKLVWDAEKKQFKKAPDQK